MSSWVSEGVPGSEDSMILDYQPTVLNMSAPGTPDATKFKFAEAYVVNEPPFDADDSRPLDDVQSPSFSIPSQESLPAPTIPEAVEPEDENDIGPTTIANEEDEPMSPIWEPEAFDLRPPVPSVPSSDVEYLAKRLFSADHLKVILSNQALATRLTNFLKIYKPEQLDLLTRYLESQKAIKATEYANAVAKGMKPNAAQTPDKKAADIDPEFERTSRDMLDKLVSHALCTYLTQTLIAIVTECLVKDIIGSNTPIMQDLVQGIAEIYCLTDPSRRDNPIVYCSHDFTRTTLYSRNYVLGRNCRFLQGPETCSHTINRMRQATAEGHEISETVLNYRRDGTPFLNLVLVAPLYDTLGKVRYFLGCQIDVTNLVDGGRGLPSFQQLLAQDQANHWPPGAQVKDSIKHLRELGGMFTDEELVAVQANANAADHARSRRADAYVPPRTKMERKYVGIDDASENSIWPSTRYGHSGRLPGVYRNYLLVRPWPAMNIVFTSASLRIPGLIQSNFLDRIAGAPHIREGVQDAFRHEIGVTAKIEWLTGRTVTSSEAKPRWIHCTPLLGSDGRAGVWMVVIIEKEQITGQFKSQLTTTSESSQASWMSSQLESSRMYADYLRRQGGSPIARGSNDGNLALPPASARSPRVARLPGGAMFFSSSVMNKALPRGEAPSRSRTAEPRSNPFAPPPRTSISPTPTTDFAKLTKADSSRIRTLGSRQDNVSEAGSDMLQAQSIPRSHTGGPLDDYIFAPPEMEKRRMRVNYMNRLGSPLAHKISAETRILPTDDDRIEHSPAKPKARLAKVLSDVRYI